MQEMSQSITRIELHQVTGLGRPLDLRIKSNRLALIGSAVLGMIGLTVGWLGGIDTWLIGGATATIAAFLGWALGREIDPDQESTAAAALVISGVLALVAEPQLLVITALLLATRIFAGTVGSELRGLDLVVVVGAAGFAGSQPVAWPIAALLVYAVVRQGSRYSMPTAAAMILAAMGSAAFFVSSFTPGSPSPLVWLLIAGLGIAAWKRLRPTKIRSAADSGDRIAAGGVGLARLATLSALAGGAILAPESAIADLGPAIAAFAAFALLPRRVSQSGEVLHERPAVVGAALPPVV